MIDRETWLILAERLYQINVVRCNEAQAQRLYDECFKQAERITLVFDSHDQATVLTVEPR